MEYRQISGESKIVIGFHPQVDMLRRLNEKLKATFWVYVTLTVFVQGFVWPQTKVVLTKVPIDEWKNEVRAALNHYDLDWNQVHTT